MRPAPPEPEWRVRPPVPPRLVAELVAAHGLPPLAAAILHGRGLLSPDDLAPPLVPSPNPALAEAARRLAAALRANKRVRVHGDYDADGITAASLLTLGLRELGADAHAFIPNRLTDGYGIHPDRVPEHADACDLLVTVDCGVANLDEVARIVEAGVEVIVTDHHAPGRDLPGCLVVHPALAPGYRPDRPALTGSGIAFHLLWALRRELGEPDPLEYADLAAIGTIADVAPLLGENRALVRAGLERMADSRWPGVHTAVAAHGLTRVTARHVAFVIAPRLNAAGRLGEAGKAYELLTTTDPARARALAAELDRRNDERRRLQDRMLREAEALVDPRDPAIVLTKDGWHAGVMGIIASRLLEQHHKPVFVVAAGKGSVRSTPGLSAVEALHAAAPHLKRFGGHDGAAGFSIHAGAFDAFRDAVNAFVRERGVPPARLLADALLEPHDVTDDLFLALGRLEPYGHGHHEPAFAIRARLDDARPMGKERNHLQFRFGSLRGKQWNAGANGTGGAGPLRSGDDANLVARVVENDWQGRVSLELHALASRPHRPLALLHEPAPPDGLAVYRLTPPEALRRLKGEARLVYADGDGLAYLRKHHPDATLHDLPAAPDGELLIFALPEPELLAAWLRGGARASFALGERTLSALESRRFWTLARLREAAAGEREGLPVPAAARELLASVDVDDPDAWLGRPELARQEAEAYRLGQFCRHYRHADDAGFAAAVRALYLD